MAEFKDKWKAYERRVVPLNAGRTQRRSTKRAFYAGALIMIEFMFGTLDNSDPGNVTDGEVQRFDDVVKEIEGELARMAARKGGARA